MLAGAGAGRTETTSQRPDVVVWAVPRGQHRAEDQEQRGRHQEAPVAPGQAGPPLERAQHQRRAGFKVPTASVMDFCSRARPSSTWPASRAA